MPKTTRVDALKKDLQQRFGLVMSTSQVGQAIGVSSRSTIDRWLRAEEKLGLKLLRFESRKGRFVLSADLAEWLIRKQFRPSSR